MKTLIYFEGPTFTLSYDPETGEVTTSYARWFYSRVLPDEDDVKHASVLGITPQEHKLAHELAHHLLALYHGLSSSPITWCAAHYYDMPDAHEDEERGVNALVYSTFGVPREEDLPSLESFERAGVSIDKMQVRLRSLLQLVQEGKLTHITITA